MRWETLPGLDLCATPESAEEGSKRHPAEGMPSTPPSSRRFGSGTHGPLTADSPFLPSCRGFGAGVLSLWLRRRFSGQSKPIGAVDAAAPRFRSPRQPSAVRQPMSGPAATQVPFKHGRALQSHPVSRRHRSVLQVAPIPQHATRPLTSRLGRERGLNPSTVAVVKTGPTVHAPRPIDHTPRAIHETGYAYCGNRRARPTRGCARAQ
jgi:hypothetical protein